MAAIGVGRLLFAANNIAKLDRLETNTKNETRATTDGYHESHEHTDTRLLHPLPGCSDFDSGCDSGCLSFARRPDSDALEHSRRGRWSWFQATGVSDAGDDGRVPWPVLCLAVAIAEAI